MIEDIARKVDGKQLGRFATNNAGEVTHLWLIDESGDEEWLFKHEDGQLELALILDATRKAHSMILSNEQAKILSFFMTGKE